VEKPRTAYVEPAGLVLSGTVERAPHSTVVAAVVEDAIRRRLREQDGAAYAPYSLYEPVDAEHSVVIAGTDVSTATHATLLDTVLTLVDGLARTGPEPESLADIMAAMRQAFTDPYNVGFLSHRAAAQALRGRPLQQTDELLAEQDAVTPATLVPDLARFRDSLMVGAPPGTIEHPGLTMVVQPQVAPTSKGARSANWPADPSRLHLTGSLLVVSNREAGIQYHLDDLAGYLVWDSGARALVLADGWSFTLEPTTWSGGDSLVRRLDELVPAGLHLPQPAGSAPEPHPRHGLAARWTGGLRRVSSGLGNHALLWWLMVAVIAVVAVASGHPGVLGPVLVGTLIGLWTGRDRDRPDRDGPY
jgi:hypothetical protein